MSWLQSTLDRCVVALGLSPARQSRRTAGATPAPPEQGDGSLPEHATDADARQIAAEADRARADDSGQSAPMPQMPALADRPLAHYVLFGPAGEPGTAVSLLLAQEYLLVRHPAFGFNPAEAAHAGRVTIIADEQAVSPQIAADLAAGGAMVQRICGSPEEVAQALAERVRSKTGRRNAVRA